MFLTREAMRRWPVPMALAFTLVFSVAVHLGASAFLNRLEAEAEAQMEARASQAARTVEQTLERHLEAFDTLFEMVRDREQLKREGHPVSAGLEVRLRRIAGEERFGVVQVSVINASGLLAWSTVPGFEGLDLSDRAHFRVHQAGEVGLQVSEPLLGRASGRWSSQVTRPLQAPDGGFGGVAVLSVDPAVLSGEMARLVDGTRSNGLLVGPTGQVIALSRDMDRALAMNLVVTELPGPGGTAFRRALGRMNGEDRLMALRGMREAPLHVGVSLVVAAEMAPFRRLALLVRLGEVATVLLFVAAAGLSLLARAQRLAETACQLAQLRQAEVTRVLDGIPAVVALNRMYEDGRNERLLVNRGMAQLLRGSPLQAEVMLLDRLEPPATAEQVRLYREELRQAGRATHEGQLRCADGQLRWMRLQSGVVGQDAAGLELVTLVTDIDTEKRAAQAAMNNARLATLGEMSAELAHELNQPLTGISLAAENARLLLAADPVANREKIAGRLDRVLAMVARARDLGTHLKLFARRQDGPLEAVDLAAAVAGACELAWPVMAESGVVLEAELPDGLPPVRGQRMLLEQALTNLLLNARDAMQVTSPAERRIRLTARRQGEQVVLCVADNGPGVPPAVLNRLFEPFFTTKPVGQGTGLGLSVCHGILQAAGGDIAVRNAWPGEPEQGAVFTLGLRVAEGQGGPEPDRLCPTQAVAC